MAPPSSRRSGFSKKAQFSLFTGYLLAGAGAVLGLALLALSLWQPAAFAPLRGVATDVVAPVGTGGAVTRSGSQGFFATISGYFNAGQQNAELRRENELARIRLAEAEAIKAENQRLKGLLGPARWRGQARRDGAARRLDRDQRASPRLYQRRKQQRGGAGDARCCPSAG